MGHDFAIPFMGWMCPQMGALSSQPDRTSRVVRRFSQANSDIRVIAGSGADKSRDGSSLAASLSQPTALCVEGKSIFVVDTTVGAIKLITATNSLCKFLELLHSLCRMFGVHLRGIKAECRTIEEATSSLSELSSLMDLWIDQVQGKMGRKSATQGPQKTISAKSQRIVEILIQSLSSMKDTFPGVKPRISKLCYTGRNLDSCGGELLQSDALKK